MILMAAVAVGCQQNDPFEDSITPSHYSDALTLQVGDPGSRVFDSELNWLWEADDEITGFQNAGNFTRNTLSWQGENTFMCERFDYSTTEPADFHFFYPAAAEQNDQSLVAVQDGTWRPLLVGTADSTTVDAIGSVTMEHLSAALEFTLYADDKTTLLPITEAVLSSESDFVGHWSADEQLDYTCTLSGKEIAVTAPEGSATVVLNMPTGSFEAGVLKLTLTSTSGVTVTRSLPAQEFVAGQRNRYQIAATKAYLPSGDAFNSAINAAIGSSTALKFVANSSTDSILPLTAASGDQPIFLVTNGDTLEIHTPAAEFIANPQNGNMMFRELTGITTIDFGNCLNTAQLTDLNSWFKDSEQLQSLDLRSLNTSNVKNMSYMFYSCNALESITFGGNFDTSKVTTMEHMFSHCEKLQTLDLSSFNTENVGSMMGMFNYCKVLEQLDLSNFNTGNVITMNNMFGSCHALKQVDLSSFNTEQVTNMRYMFYCCYELTKLDLSNFNTEKVDEMREMFLGCHNLAELDLRSFSFNLQSNYVSRIFNSLGSKLDYNAKIYVTQEGFDFLNEYATIFTGSVKFEFVIVSAE